MDHGGKNKHSNLHLQTSALLMLVRDDRSCQTSTYSTGVVNILQVFLYTFPFSHLAFYPKATDN